MVTDIENEAREASILRHGIAQAIHDGPHAQQQYRDTRIGEHRWEDCRWQDEYLQDADAVVAFLASRVSTPPSEIAVTAEQIRSRLSNVRAYYDATWATRYLAAPSASELIWVLTGEEAWGEAYLDREYEPPVPAVPAPPTEPADDIEFLRRTAQRLRTEHDLSSALEIEAVIREREAAPKEPAEHGMLPGSHEHGGAECRCGMPWDYWNDRCLSMPAPTEPEVP